jgi:hypothetical protein
LEEPGGIETFGEFGIEQDVVIPVFGESDNNEERGEVYDNGTGTEYARETSRPTVQEGDGKEEEITRDDIELRDAVGDNN